MTCRFRNMCFTTSKARRRGARWVLKLLPYADEAMEGGSDRDGGDNNDDDDDDNGRGPECEAKPKYTVGFNIELGLAFRQAIDNQGKIKGAKQLSLPMDNEEISKQDLTAPLKAKWKDGSVLEIEDLTREQWEQIQTQRTAGVQNPIVNLWEMESSNRHALYIAQRVDRTLLVSLYEQGKQILMVRADKFAELPSPQPARVPNDHPAIVKALALMAPIATDYAKGVIQQGDKVELKRRRDEALGKSKANERNAAALVKKRPSAAQHHETPTRNETQFNTDDNGGDDSDDDDDGIAAQALPKAKKTRLTTPTSAKHEINESQMVREWLQRQDDASPPHADSLALFSRVASTM